MTSTLAEVFTDWQDEIAFKFKLMLTETLANIILIKKEILNFNNIYRQLFIYHQESIN